MKASLPHRTPRRVGLSFLLLFLAVPHSRADEPSPAALAAFNARAAKVNGRLDAQHRSPQTFPGSLISETETQGSLHRGELVIEQLTPPGGEELPGALLHHWRGSAFIPGVTAAQMEQLLRDYSAYPRHYAPQVLATHILAQQSDRYQVTMRLRQQHVLTVNLDATYDVRFGRLDPAHAFSFSRSTHIDELDSAGHPLSPADQHGFLWQLDTWWTFAEQDGGLYVQLETLSLTRSIPTGLAWAVRPFIASVPRDSLAFTLRSTANALRSDTERAGKGRAPDGKPAKSSTPILERTQP